MLSVNIFCIMIALGPVVHARGLMLLYRPMDITRDCARSEQLRYDVSFGMGMSDTITLVLRTMSELDYECLIEIVTERDSLRPNIRLLIVLRFPNNIGFNCLLNPSAFILLKKNMCFLLCDHIRHQDVYATYYATSSLTRFRFKFVSNSSINTDMNANLYEITATSARKKGKGNCNRINETICIIDSEEFCFTSGVVCDGIKNCGANDWFDERKSECELPMEQLGVIPVIAVGALIVCTLVAAIHILLRFLPPLANSFFIFNANEDNRFCIDPVFESPDTHSKKEVDHSKRKSIIPVFFSSSDEEDNDEQRKSLYSQVIPAVLSHESLTRPRNMKSMSERIQQRLKSVTGRGKTFQANAGTSFVGPEQAFKHNDNIGKVTHV